MTPDEYCQDKLKKSGSSFSLSFVFLPDEKRSAMTALYAFCREVDDVVDECTDIDIARIKLQWWRDEIARAYADQAQHPVTKALVTAIKNYNLPQEYFFEIIDGMEMDLDIHRYESFNQLNLYCYRAAGVVGLISAEIFGYSDRHTQKYAHNLGTAFQLTNIIRDIHEDAQRGRIYLPQDEMDEHGVSDEDILSHRMSDNMRSLLTFQTQRAMEYYQQAMDCLPEQDRLAQKSGLIMAAIYQAVLEKIIANNHEVMDKRVSLPAWRKLWLAWSTARKEQLRSVKKKPTSNHSSSLN